RKARLNRSDRIPRFRIQLGEQLPACLPISSSAARSDSPFVRAESACGAAARYTARHLHSDWLPQIEWSLAGAQPAPADRTPPPSALESALSTAQRSDAALTRS